MTEHAPDETPDDSPPVFSSWTHWYALVLFNLVVLIALFYWFTRAYD